MSVRFVLLLALVVATSAQGGEDVIVSGMKMDRSVGGASEIDQLEVVADSDSGAMRRAGMLSTMPAGGENEMLESFEDHLDIGGSGEAMQLSGPHIPVAVKDDRQVEVEEVEASADMSPEAAALTRVFGEKEAQLADYRQMLEASKNGAENESNAAKRLMTEAHSKQAYLNELQTKILEQTAALEAQKQALRKQQQEFDSYKSDFEQKVAGLNSAQATEAARRTMNSAIQSQLSDLDAKKKAFEIEQADSVQQLSDLKATLEQLKNTVDFKDSELGKKEGEMKKLYADLNSLTKATQHHELEIKQKESELQNEEQQVKEKENKLREQELKLNSHTQLSEERVEELSGQQIALQAQAGLRKALTELPAGALIEPQDDTSVLDQFRAQPMNLPAPHVRNLTVITPKSHPNLVDRTTRDVEAREPRPSTYGEKLLVGQAYSAKTVPKADGRDSDGKCRNSRGDTVDCSLYGQDDVPPIVPSISDLLSDEYADLNTGPCVLKCNYHKGLTTVAGTRNIAQVSVEIPTKTVTNRTFACSKFNNGFPLVSCDLFVDDTDVCRSTCVFDGQANPLKPNKLNFGMPHTGEGSNQLNKDDFRTLAHTTYQERTGTGCKSSMKADPLVACEVVL